MEKIIIEKDNCKDVEHFVKFNLHKYNQKIVTISEIIHLMLIIIQ